MHDSNAILLRHYIWSLAASRCTVLHESEGDGMQAKERVLLIFDVWHPKVDTNEQNIFTLYEL